MVTNPARLGTKNDCAGETQQQFPRHIELSYKGAIKVEPTKNKDLTAEEEAPRTCLGQKENLGHIRVSRQDMMPRMSVL
jgi:hypothetical protein